MLAVAPDLPDSRALNWLNQKDAPEQRCDEHNQGDIEREARAGLIAMHRYGLVAIRDDGREDKEERRDIARQSREPIHHGGFFVS